VRTHGWSGDTPASDGEAVARILKAARRQIDCKGSDVSIAEVARDVGVSRQTVYRYFPSSEALLIATAIAEAGPFLDRMAIRLRGVVDPAEAVIEGIAHTLECLPSERHLSALLTPGRSTALTAEVTSDIAMSFGRSIVERFDVDWARAGASDADLDELVEFMLRVLQSLIINPGHPPRTGDDLRGFLDRWVGPALSRFRRISTGGPMGDRSSAAAHEQPETRPGQLCLKNRSVSRYLLVSDVQWSAISDLMPGRTAGRGRPPRGRRQVLEGIVYRHRTGIPWREVPAMFGPWQTIWAWYRRMSADGTWRRVQDAMIASSPPGDAVAGWTIAPDDAMHRAHRRALTVTRAVGGWVEFDVPGDRAG
jgi:AcrR family transcriptional regulator/transposase